MAVKRGRPPKKKKEEEVVEVNENVSKETEEKVDKEDTTMDEIKEFMKKFRANYQNWDKI